MAESIKFTNKYVDTTGIYDSALQITQAELNSKAVTVDLTSASIGTPNPVNADTLGGDPASDFFKSANVVNNFTTTESGYALDARAGKSLNDSLTKNNIDGFTIITSQTVSPNKYTFPSDGYVFVSLSGNGGNATLNIFGATTDYQVYYSVATTGNNPSIVYVKKGMRFMVYSTTGGATPTVRFYPFT